MILGLLGGCAVPGNFRNVEAVHSLVKEGSGGQAYSNSVDSLENAQS